MHLLAGSDGNVTVVGDDDQAIYRFRSRRAAQHPRLRRALPAPRARRARPQLPLARRDPRPPPPAASPTTSTGTRRRWSPCAARAGGSPRAASRCDRDEAGWAAGLIADALAAGTAARRDPRARPHRASPPRPIQAALAAAGIPHRVLGSLGLYERAEVRDALAYLALLANPRDAHAFRRAVQAPRRGVGTATIGARRRRRARALRRRPDHHQRQRARSCTGVRSAADPRRARRVRRRPGGRARRSTGPAARSGTSSSPRSRSTAASSPTTRRAATARRAPSERRDGERVLEDLRSLCRAAQAYADQVGSGASITGFLEHAAGLHAEEIRPGEDRRITVSTIHRAKGTEAQLVLLLGCEEQLLPSWRALRERRPRGPRGGTAAVLRRRHPRQGPPRPHPLPRPRRTRHRRPLALPRRGRPRHARRARSPPDPPIPSDPRRHHAMPDRAPRPAPRRPRAPTTRRSRSSGARSRPARSAFAP